MPHRATLDSRSEFIQDVGANSVRVSTQYIMTMREGRQRFAIEFSDETSASFPSGVTCRATGALLSRLLAPPAG